MTRQIIAPKKAGETIPVSFDFGPVLMNGSTTLSAPAVTCTLYSGTDANPSAMISGAASASGQIVTQSITGGVAGNIYVLTCTVTTATPAGTRQITAFLAITPALP